MGNKQGAKSGVPGPATSFSSAPPKIVIFGSYAGGKTSFAYRLTGRELTHYDPTIEELHSVNITHPTYGDSIVQFTDTAGSNISLVSRATMVSERLSSPTFYLFFKNEYLYLQGRRTTRP